jgi:hypothetical protein
MPNRNSDIAVVHHSARPARVRASLRCSLGSRRVPFVPARLANETAMADSNASHPLDLVRCHGPWLTVPPSRGEIATPNPTLISPAASLWRHRPMGPWAHRRAAARLDESVLPDPPSSATVPGRACPAPVRGARHLPPCPTSRSRGELARLEESPAPVPASPEFAPTPFGSAEPGTLPSCPRPADQTAMPTRTPSHPAHRNGLLHSANRRDPCLRQPPTTSTSQQVCIPIP